MERTYAVYIYTTSTPHGWATKRITLQSTSCLQAQLDVTSTEEYKSLSSTHEITEVKAVLTHGKEEPDRTPEEDIAWHNEIARRHRSGEFEYHRIGV